jgi:hypothetical protein
MTDVRHEPELTSQAAREANELELRLQDARAQRQRASALFNGSRRSPQADEDDTFD